MIPFIWLGFGPAASLFGQVGSLAERVRRLEVALVLTLDALQTLAERLEDRFGPEFLDGGLRQLGTVGSDADLEEVIDNIDRLVREGQQPAAARQFREAFGATWDQAHQAIDVVNYFLKV